MVGLDLDLLAKDNPQISVAMAEVYFINQAAHFLRAARQRAKITQSEMARKLGLSQSRVAQLESGKPANAPSLGQIAAYAYLCGLRLSFREDGAIQVGKSTPVEATRRTHTATMTA